MALFKILKGNENNLPTTKTPGYMYITEDQGNIFVDLSTTERIQLNAKTASKATSVYYGECSTAAGTAAKVLTVDDTFKLIEGAQITVKFTNSNSASNPTLNVNGTGAKPIRLYGTTAAGTATTSTGWAAGAIQIFTYDGTAWYRNYWQNAYTNAAFGQGYATCSTAEATLAKTASLNSYALTTGGIVAVKFTYAVPASATLNVNSKGAKPIYYKGAAIKAGVIKAGDIATFMYNGSQYHLLAIDRWQDDTATSIKDLSINGTTITYTKNDGTTGTLTTQDTNTTSFTITANASDDDVVILAGQGGSNAVSYTATHALKGPSTTANTTKGATANVTIDAAGESGSIKVPKVTVDKYGHTTGLTEQTLSISIPESIKNPNALTVGSKTYDGSSATTITAADLGLASAMKFLGTTTTAITDGATINPIIIGGTNTTATAGNVVLYGEKEFVFNSVNKWEELGNEGNYKVVQTAVSSPAASGTAVAFIDTISQDTNGVITATKKTVSAVTTSAAGLMSAADKVKLDGISAGANAYVLPTASSTTLGGVKTTSTVTSTSGLTACPIISGVPYYKDTNTTYLAGKGLTLSDTTFKANLNSETSLGTIGTTSKLYAVGVDANNKLCVSVPWTDSNTTYTAGTGLSLSGTTFSLSASGVTAKTYGPSADVMGNNEVALTVPQITVDIYGRVTSVVDRTYTSVNIDTNTDTSVKTTAKTSGTGYVTTCAGAGTAGLNYHTSVYVNHSTGVLMGAAWNDYAEYRETKTEIEPGRVVIETGNGDLVLSQERMAPAPNVVSDTFGFAIGQTEKCNTPIAIAGRALVYPFEDRENFKAGDVVCAGPEGTVSLMTREEIKEYPDRILGIVSEIPNYETWGETDIKVNNRIWIKIR